MNTKQLVTVFAVMGLIFGLGAGIFVYYAQKPSSSRPVSMYEVEENKDQTMDAARVWRGNLGSTTTFTGRAQNAKAGAVLLMPDDTPLYIENLPAWPDASIDTYISATGLLLRNKFIPDPINDKGELTQGAEGEQWVLRGATWEATKNP